MVNDPDLLEFRAQQIFDKIDTDNNKTVDFDEFK